MVIAVNDGSWRYPKAVSVNDSGTWRTVKGLAVNDGSAWRGTNLIAAVTGANTGALHGLSIGIGSISNGFGMDGVELYEVVYSTGTLSTYVHVRCSDSSLVSATQTNYLKLVTVAGTTVNTSSAIAFVSSGIGPDHARWEFSGDVFGLPAKDGTTFSVQLTKA